MRSSWRLERVKIDHEIVWVIDPDHALRLAREHEMQGRQLEARRLFAEIGDVEGLTALGKNLLTRPPIEPYEGVARIVDAANKGGAEAAYLCGTMSALGAGLAQNWSMAIDCVAASAERGWAKAKDELGLLGGTSIDLATLLEPGTLREVHHTPRIAIAEKFLKPEFCDWLVAQARPKIERARTFRTAEGTQDKARSNSVAEFNFVEIDIVLAIIRTRIASLTGLAARGLENTQVLHYAAGQRFAPHYDYLDPANPAVAQSIAEFGQRVATFLVYLNDDFDGAETEFPKLDWRWRGAKGDAIAFWNVDEAGKPDASTLHAGLMPTRGEKWLLSQWIRQAR